MPRRLRLLLAIAVLAAPPALSPGAALAAGLSDDQVRSFLDTQQRAWNAGDLEAYFAGFAPDAVFIDEYRTPAGQVVPYGSSPLSKARVQTRRFRAAAKVSETGEIVRIARAADGRSAEVVSRVVSRTEGPKGLRVTCAERRQELILAAGRLRSRGQTDTFARCPRSR